MSDKKFPDDEKPSDDKNLIELNKKFPNDKTLSELRKKFESVIPLAQPSLEIEIENLSEITIKKIDWLWKDIIANGKLTLFAGEPGVGKSQLLLYIASIKSKGEKFHYEKNPCDEGKVLLISGEDDSCDTIVPRLKALNANLDNIKNVKGIKRLDKNGNPYYDVICLVDHLAELEKKIVEDNYKLLIVDPISMHLGSVDENKNKEIRAALGIISSLAQRHNIALVINSHFTKPSGSSNKNAIYRVMGSIGFAAAARIVYGIMKDPEDEARRLFIPIKNNIGQDKTGFVYKIKPILLENSIETCRIEWLDEKIEKTANEILNHSLPHESPKLEEVKQFLTNMLKNGSVPLSEITKEAEKLGYSYNRLYKARDELKIYVSESFAGKRGKIWMLA